MTKIIKGSERGNDQRTIVMNLDADKRFEILLNAVQQSCSPAANYRFLMIYAQSVKKLLESNNVWLIQFLYRCAKHNLPSTNVQLDYCVPHVEVYSTFRCSNARHDLSCKTLNMQFNVTLGFVDMESLLPINACDQPFVIKPLNDDQAGLFSQIVLYLSLDYEKQKGIHLALARKPEVSLAPCIAQALHYSFSNDNYNSKYRFDVQCGRLVAGTEIRQQQSTNREKHEWTSFSKIIHNTCIFSLPLFVGLSVF